MIQYIQESCGLFSIKARPTKLFKDNVACIAQLKGGYIKGNRNKHISLKFFYTHDSSRLIHKVIINLNIQEANIQDWNVSTE